MAGESLPDSNNPLNLQLSDGQLVRYEDGIGGTNVTFEAVKRSFVLPPLVQTGCVLQKMDLFKTWLADEQPIIVSGPEGCGKNLLIRHSIGRLQDEFDLTFNVIVLHCNARTSSKDVLQKLRQFCSITTGTSGRIYRPKEGRRLVFYMKDINLPPDKYDTSEIVMFLSQVVIHNGFYDDDLKFVQLERVQIVSSMAPASTLGRPSPCDTPDSESACLCNLVPDHGGTDRGVLANGRCRTHQTRSTKTWLTKLTV